MSVDLEQAQASVDLGDPDGERRAALAGSILATLDDHALVAVTGADARDFLQRQLTADLEEVTTQRTRLAAWCNPAGRVRLLMRVWQLGEGLCIEAPRERLAAELAGLRRFVLRSKVRFEGAERRWLRFGLAGPQAPAALSEVLAGEPPGRPDEVRTGGQAGTIYAARLPGTQERYELLAEPGGGERLRERLATRLRPVGSGAWRLLELAAGVPRVEAPAAERHLPQMLDLEALGALSYTKGCYPGQEVVARTHYRGQLKRRLMLLRLTASARRPQIGATIRDPDGARLGEVLAGEPLPGGGWLVAAVCAPGAGPRLLEGDPGDVLEAVDAPIGGSGAGR